MPNGLTIILLVLLLDIAVIWSVVRSALPQKYKLLYILIILLIPVLGVIIYYLISSINMKYLELIKKTIVVTITIIVTVFLFGLTVSFLLRDSMKEVSLKSEYPLKSEYRE